MERYGQLKKDEMKAKKTYVYIYISWGGGGGGKQRVGLSDTISIFPDFSLFLDN